MKTKLVILFLLAATGAGASLITITDTFVSMGTTLPSSTPSGQVTASYVNEVIDPFTLSATACFDGYCPGQSSPGAGPDFLVNSPLSMRVTGLTGTFSAAGLFSSDLSGAAFFTWVSPSLVGVTVPVTLSIDGTAPGNVSTHYELLVTTCDGNNQNCIQVGKSADASKGPGNALSGTVDVGNFTFNLITRVELDYDFTGLVAGQTVTLPDSLAVTFGTANVVGNNTPEPGTLLSLLGGLLVLGGLQRRFSRR